MATRKTVKVKTIINLVNQFNRRPHSSDAERRAANSLLENILHLTDSYAGFCYHNPSDFGGEWESRREYCYHRDI